MKLRLTVKSGIKTLFEVEGIELDEHCLPSCITKVIEIEQSLEQLLGLRFHISQVK